ncbi:bifunctional hydroxymethylpyrimidine kinase/phosphomethylpyrimidine kinase [Streptomyces sp. 4N509B]|uniref:bifunctional hydroxymethylpyrimidine kinase/phosphomethylpyrimidine kinase n=1 Tax=Streptomyces sp. 4N509B TaxID=3457413 RepID=UPI003FD507E1
MTTGTDGDAAAVPVCLTIGSSDSGGGAGIQGDVKAYAAVGCYAATVVVGVTAQNTTGISDRWAVPVPMVLEQLRAVLEDFPVAAAKIGTTWSVELLEALAPPLREMTAGGTPLVVDPVMVTAAGSWLSDSGRIRDSVIETLFPLATALTPNRREAELLVGAAPGTTSREELAEALVGLGARAVVITAGTDESGDWFHDGRRHTHIPGPRHATGAEHGAGCAHSSLLAGLLAQGWPLLDAAVEAHRRAARSVRGGHLGIGRAVHPVDALGLAAHAAAPAVPDHGWTTEGDGGRVSERTTEASHG